MAWGKGGMQRALVSDSTNSIFFYFILSTGDGSELKPFTLQVERFLGKRYINGLYSKQCTENSLARVFAFLLSFSYSC